MTKSLEDKVILITGASRGIGYATAIEAAARGAHVVAVARTVGGLEDLDDTIQAAGGSCTLVPMDLTDYDAIDRMGAAIFDRWGRLDGLIGNAGALGILSPLPHISPEDFEKVMTLNVTANYRLIRAFDLPLRKSEAGRVVMISSGAARSCKPYWSAYAASKAALEALIKSFAEEMVASNVKANVFDPGRVRTAMRAKAVPGEDPETLPQPSEIAPYLVDMVMPTLDKTRQLYSMSSKAFTPL